MNNNVLYILFYLISIILITVNGSKISDAEYECLGLFFTKVGVTKYVINTTLGYIDYCNIDNSIKCNVLNQVTQLNAIKQTTNNIIELSDISSLQYLTTFDMVNCQLSTTFLSGPFTNKFYFIRLNTCNIKDIFTGPISTSITYFEITQTQPTDLTFNLSWISSITNAFHFQANAQTSSNSVIVNNDLQPNKPLSLATMTLGTSNLPDLSNVYISSMLSIILNNHPSSYSNVLTYSNSPNVLFYQKSTIPIQFPIEFSQIVSTTSTFDLELSFSGGFLEPTSKIDLSSSNVYSLKISSAGNLFNINNQVPFIFNDRLISFIISGGSFTSIVDMNSFGSGFIQLIMSYNQMTIPLPNYVAPTIKKKSQVMIDVSNNQISGTIGSSWCGVNLLISNNSISDPLPTCLSCHYGSLAIKSRLSDNALISSTQPTCTTLIPNMYFNVTEKVIYIFGQDLGFSNIVSNGYTFQVIKPSTLFAVSISDDQVSLVPDIFNLTWSYLPQKYTVTSKYLQPPAVNIATALSTKSFQFDGSYFSYNTTIVKVVIDSLPCELISTTFYQIQCKITSPTFNTSQISVPVIIYIDKSYQSFLMNLNGETIISSCTVACNNGICSGNVCKCNKGFEGTDCSLISCSNPCNNGGTCNNTIGVCNCPIGYEGIDCTLLSCSNTCNNGGTCDKTIGSCKCKKNWTGIDCSTANQYVNSVISTSITGGIVYLIGWFGSVYSNQVVTIGGLNCDIKTSNDTVISCIIPGGTGIKSITVFQNGITFTGIDLFQYTNPIKQCPNQCTSNSHGNCNTVIGECICNSLYSGYDCSSLSGGNIGITSTTTTTTTTASNNPDGNEIPPSSSNVNSSTGVTVITNQDTFYEISIISLNEIDINGAIVVENKLVDKWNITSLSTDNIYMFNQTISNDDDDDCYITYKIEEVKETKQYEFANSNFTVESGSIKISVSIYNYQFLNSLNTLQLLFVSSVNEKESSSENNECNKQDTESSVNNLELSNYIRISKNKKVLYGRFINKVISDGKPTFMNSQVINNTNNTNDTLIVALNLPHCSNCYIDPDFSVLVSDQYKTCDGNESNSRPSWFLPVVIVVPVVGVTAIVIISSIIYRKQRVALKVIKLQFLSRNKN